MKFNVSWKIEGLSQVEAESEEEARDIVSEMSDYELGNDRTCGVTIEGIECTDYGDEEEQE